MPGFPFVGAGVTMMLGSIPQQDVFQRITSAKDERTAVRGSLMGAALYFCFCFVPMFIAYSALAGRSGEIRSTCWNVTPSWFCRP